MFNKLSFFLFVVFIFSLNVAAQPKIQRSATFEMPVEDCYMKVMQFKSGNTCYLDFIGDGGISFRLFDVEHKLKLTSKIKSAKWDGYDLNGTAIRATHEINGELVIFLLQQNKKDIVLYRIRINEETGNIIKEDELASEHKSFIIPFSAYARGFIIQKDFNSDCYGVITSEIRIGSLKCMVMHFDGTHKLLTSCPFYAKEQQPIYPIGITVNGDKAVYVAAGLLNSMHEAGNVFIAKIDRGAKEADYKALDYTQNFKDVTCQLRYNSNDNKLQMLLTSFVKSKAFSDKNIYNSFFALINADNLNVTSVKEVSNRKINEFSHNILAKENDFTGICNGFATNGNNGIFLLNEEMTLDIASGKSASFIRSTTLGNIGIAQLDSLGEETAGYLIEREVKADGEVPIMFLADNGNGSWVKPAYRMHDASGKQEVKFLFINGKKSDYVLINDLDVYVQNGNVENLTKKEYKNATVQASYYSLKDGKIAKAFLFDKPTFGINHTCYIGAADVSRNDVLVTVEVTTDGKKQIGNIVWVAFE